MKLTLEATGDKKDTDRLGAARRCTFTEEGGSIGRSPGNAWVLDHKLVSKLHAEIAFEHGVFTIEDLGSSNGTSINGSPIESRVPHQIRDGDSLFIDPFTIDVRVSNAAAERGGKGMSERGGKSGSAFDIIKPHNDWPEKHDTEEPPLDLPYSEHIPLPRPVQPAPTPGPGRVPENYNPFDSGIQVVSEILPEPPSRHTPSPPQKPAPAQPHAASSTGAPDNLALVLSKAGVEGVHVTPEVVDTLAKVLRTVVDGLMDVFEARRTFKTELDIESTQFRRRQTAPVNNPLKFAGSVEDALKKLFVETPQGYMGPVRAFEDAFADLRNHELAMTAGIGAAFAKVLEAFDPDDLEKLFDERAKASLVPKPGSMRYWEQYRQLLSEMAKEADTTSDRLLKEPFASAYQAQLERLRAAKRGAS